MYKIGLTVYDEDNMLWETKVGLYNENMPLLYSVWAKTPKKSLKMAIELTERLMMNKIYGKNRKKAT